MKELKDFSRVHAYSEERIYPPILDKDPAFAASFLTIADSKRSYEILIESYEAIKSDKSVHFILEDSMLHSYVNFMWFASFFRKLEELLEVGEAYEIPFEKSPEKDDSEEPQFQPPLHLSSNHIVYNKYRAKNISPITKHRIEYIKKNLELSEFRDGFPAWYILQETTIFENYNPRTNVRTRLDYRNGEYRYFVSGASDNWQEVCDVPLEIDYFITALLLR